MKTKNGGWSLEKDLPKSTKAFTKEELKDQIRFLVRNSYCKHNGKIYRQIKGAGMGMKSSPQFCDFLLLAYEYIAILICVTNYDKKNAKVIATITRFQDDIFCPYVDNFSKIMNKSED